MYKKGGLGLNTQTTSSKTLNKNDERIMCVRSQQDDSQITCSVDQKAKVINKGKVVATMLSREKQVPKKSVGNVSKKKQHTEKCNHPYCYVSQKRRTVGDGKFSNVTFSGKKDVPETNKVVEKRSQKGARNDICYKAIGKQLAREYKQEQE